MALGAWRCKSEFGRISFGFFKPAEKIGITILCDQEGGRDLVPITIWNAHLMSI